MWAMQTFWGAAHGRGCFCLYQWRMDAMRVKVKTAVWAAHWQTGRQRAGSARLRGGQTPDAALSRHLDRLEAVAHPRASRPPARSCQCPADTVLVLRSGLVCRWGVRDGPYLGLRHPGMMLRSLTLGLDLGRSVVGYRDQLKQVKTASHDVEPTHCIRHVLQQRLERPCTTRLVFCEIPGYTAPKAIRHPLGLAPKARHRQSVQPRNLTAIELQPAFAEIASAPNGGALVAP